MLPTGLDILDKKKTFTEYKYSLEDEDFEDSYEFKSSWDKDNPEYIAEDAAKHHYNDGGWEDDWPIKLTVWNIDGTLLGVFEVHMDLDPVFNARMKKKG